MGITRGLVIDIAKELALPVDLGLMTLKNISSSEEVFATSTAGGIMPITKINGKKVGLGNFGEITRKFHKIYWDKHFDPNCSVSIKNILY